MTASRHVFDLFHQLNQRRPFGEMTRCVVQVGCRMRLIAGRHCANQLRKRLLQLLSRVHGSQEMASFKDLLQKNCPAASFTHFPLRLAAMEGSICDVPVIRAHGGRFDVLKIAIMAPDCLRFSVAFMYNFGTTTIFDWPSGKVWPIELGGEYAMTSCGRYITRNRPNRSISRVTEVETGRVIFRRTTLDFDNYLRSWFARGHVFYMNGRDTFLCVLRISESMFIPTVVVVGRPGMIQTIADEADISADGKLLVTLEAQRTVHVWDIATSQVLHSLSSELHEVHSCMFTEQGMILAQFSKVDREEVDVAGGLMRWNFVTGRKDTCLCVTPFGTLCVGTHVAYVRARTEHFANIINIYFYDISRADRICRLGHLPGGKVAIDGWKSIRVVNGFVSIHCNDGGRGSMLAFLCGRRRLARQRRWTFMSNEVIEMLFTYF